MVYEVTCNQCGIHYRVKTPGGETRQVVCPSCGHKMTVAFPRVEGKESPKRHKSETHKALWAMLIVLIVGLPLGAYAFYLYHQNQMEERALYEQKRAERKAHVDSLNAIRARQRADEQAAIKQKAMDERVAQFLTSFYDDTYFGHGNPNSYRESLTENCFQRLLSDGDIINDSLAWGQFYPTLPEVYKDELYRNFRIQPQGDGWYGVVFRAQGMTQTRQLRVVKYRDRLLVDDYK